MTAALTATAMLRKDTSNSGIDSSTTAAISTGIRCEMLAVLSMATAVAPPTCTVAWPPAIAAGRTSARGVRTRSSVRMSCGPVVGVTIMIAVSPAGFNCAGLTAAPRVRMSMQQRPGWRELLCWWVSRWTHLAGWW